MDSGIAAASSSVRSSLCDECKRYVKVMSFQHHSLASLQNLGDDYCHRCYVIARGVQALIEKHKFPTVDTWSRELRIDIGSMHDRIYIRWIEENTLISDCFAMFFLDSARSKYGWPTTTWHNRPSGSAPTAALQFACQELDKCSERHDCQLWKKGFLPKRLVDVQSTAVEEDGLRVIESAKLPRTKTVRYVAPSYCWGEKSPFKDQMLEWDKAVLAEMEHGLPFSSLPTVHRDAVTTTRRLGFQYLWIDALCIAQGDVEEWKTESLKMAEIYSYASVTIAADAALNCDQWFLDTQSYRQVSDSIEVPGSEIPGVSPKVLVRIQEQSLYANYGTLGFPSCPSIMETRGWTFQESLLSRRVLSFRHTHVHFRCMGGMQSEHGFFSRTDGRRDWKLSPYDIFRDAHFHDDSKWREMLCASATKPLGTDELANIWLGLLESYLERDLTYSCDRLLAIAGVALVFCSRAEKGNFYLAGLWKDTFVEQLPWHREPSKLIEPQRGQRYQHLTRKVPSWSWASLTGPLRPPEFPGPGSRKDRAEIYHTRLVESPSSCDDFDGTMCGPAVLEGPFDDAIIQPDSITPATLGYVIRVASGNFALDTPLEVAQTPCMSGVTLQRAQSVGNDEWVGGQAHIHLLLIYASEKYSHFLCLTKSAKNDEQYSRIGFWLVENGGEEPVEAAPTSIIEKIPQKFIDNLPIRRIPLV